MNTYIVAYISYLGPELQQFVIVAQDELKAARKCLAERQDVLFEDEDFDRFDDLDELKSQLLDMEIGISVIEIS